jgi:pantetheine-phosphate adenylyltransferase
MERLPLLVVGGTFDNLHAGHRRLLGEAFRHSRRVGIGLLVDSLVRKSPGKGQGVAPYEVRKTHLEAWLKKWFPAMRWYTAPLEDRLGTTLDPQTPAIAVSEETFPAAVKANAWRVSHGRSPLTVVLVGRLYGEDLLPVASRRIRRGEIDSEGNRLISLKVEVERNIPFGTREAILDGFRELIPGFAVGGGRSGPPDYHVKWVSSERFAGITITDSFGGTLEAGVTPQDASEVVGSPDRCGVVDTMASQLIWEAFTPRWLSRKGILPPSLVVYNPPALWPRAETWTRKVYSPSGTFPFQ